MDSPELNNTRKEDWSKSWRILNEGRNDFLGYIGALSGQILLGTIAALLYQRRALWLYSLSDDSFSATVFFVVFLLVVVLGMIANGMRLYQGCGFHKDLKTWPVRVECCFMLLFVALTIAMVLVMSFSAASGILKANLHEPVVCAQANATR